MKKWVVFFGVVIFISTLTTKAFSQDNAVQAMRFTHDFNIIGLKTEKQAAWVDSIMTSFPQIFSSTTDFKTSHTKVVVHEAFNSQAILQKIITKLGFDIDKASYVIKYEQ